MITRGESFRDVLLRVKEIHSMVPPHFTMLALLSLSHSGTITKVNWNELSKSHSNVKNILPCSIL